MKIANNPTAQEYDSLQKQIDWATVPPTKQMEIMEKMRDVLTDAYWLEPIFVYGSTSYPYQTAGDQLDVVNRRIKRFTQ